MGTGRTVSTLTPPRVSRSLPASLLICHRETIVGAGGQPRNGTAWVCKRVSENALEALWPDIAPQHDWPVCLHCVVMPYRRMCSNILNND